MESQRWVVIQNAILNHPWAPKCIKIYQNQTCAPESTIPPYFIMLQYRKWKWHVVTCSCCEFLWCVDQNDVGPYLWHERHWHQLPKTETSPRNIQSCSWCHSRCFWDLLRFSVMTLWQLYMIYGFMTTVILLMFNLLMGSWHLEFTRTPCDGHQNLEESSGKTDYKAHHRNTMWKCVENISDSSMTRHDKTWQLHDGSMIVAWSSI